MSYKPTVDDMTEFVLDYCDGLFKWDDYEQIAKYIAIHQKYGTLFVVSDPEKRRVVAMVRWNWLSEDTALILDCIVHPDFRHKAMIKELILRAKQKLPQLEFLTFHRKKHNNRVRAYMIDEWLERKERVI